LTFSHFWWEVSGRNFLYNLITCEFHVISSSPIFTTKTIMDNQEAVLENPNSFQDLKAKPIYRVPLLPFIFPLLVLGASLQHFAGVPWGIFSREVEVTIEWKEAERNFLFSPDSAPPDINGTFSTWREDWDFVQKMVGVKAEMVIDLSEHLQVFDYFG